jgi:hypothetical protein
MTITEKTLRKWRREALREVNELPLKDSSITSWAKIILQLTQELLDQALLRKGGTK